MTTGLIIVSGAPGAGKSTLAKQLVSKFHLTWLEVDCVGNPFAEERGNDYLQNIEPKLIQGMLNTAQLNLTAKQSVLLDGPWTHWLLQPDCKWHDAIINICNSAKVNLVVLECEVSEQVLRQRITQRAATRDAAKIENEQAWQQFLQHVKFGAENPLPHYVINLEQEPQQCFTQVAVILHDCFYAKLGAGLLDAL